MRLLTAILLTVGSLGAGEYVVQMERGPMLQSGTVTRTIGDTLVVESDSAEELRQQANVAAVEPNYKYFLHPTLQGSSEHGYARRIMWHDVAPEMREKDIIPVILDTGTTPDHPGLPELWKNPDEKEDGRDTDFNGWIDDLHGVDVADGDTDVTDVNGHGTHVHGIVASERVGIAPGAAVLPIKIFRDDGGTDLATILSGLNYLIEIQRQTGRPMLLNMSWGGPNASEMMEERLAEIEGIKIAAAGNSGSTNKFYPAAYDGVHAVEAVDRRINNPHWSQRGDWIDWAAPGVDILSTWKDDGFNTISGTSMASPHAMAWVYRLYNGSVNETLELMRQHSIKPGLKGLLLDGHFTYFGSEADGEESEQDPGREQAFTPIPSARPGMAETAPIPPATPGMASNMDLVFDASDEEIVITE